MKLSPRFWVPTFIILSASAISGCNEDQLNSDPLDGSTLSEDTSSSLNGVAPRITSGKLTTEYRSVGYLSSSRSGRMYCTATLIGPRTVLTAAHCLEGTSSGWFTNDFFSSRWSKAISHPRYRNNSDYDIGLVILDQAINSVTPSPLYRSTVQSGQTINLVGYGYASNNTNAFVNGDKYVGSNRISSVDPLWFAYRGDSNNCSGDSGGPSFIGSQLAGVHAWGDGNRACSESIGWDVRVDIYLDWIADNAVGPLGGSGSGGNPDNEPDNNPDNVGNPTVSMSQTSYRIGETISVQFANLSGNRLDWIGLYRKGTDHEAYLDWFYTDGDRSGNMEFNTNLESGQYEARLYLDDSYLLEDTISFTISDSSNDEPQPTPEPNNPNEAAVSMNQTEYSVGETISVQFANLPGNTWDWIGIYRKGTDHDAYLDWYYTEGDRSGNMLFNTELSTGEYEARLYFDDSYDLEDSVTFRVTASSASGGSPDPDGGTPAETPSSSDFSVEKAEYKAKRSELKLKLVSSADPGIELYVEGYGTMKRSWKGGNLVYKFKAKKVAEVDQVIISSSAGHRFAVDVKLK